VLNNDKGICANPAVGNYIASNRSSGNNIPYDIGAGNTVGSGDLANINF